MAGFACCALLPLCAAQSQIDAEEEEEEDQDNADVSMETDTQEESIDKNKSQDVSKDQQVDPKCEKDSHIVAEKTTEPADTVTVKNSRGNVVGEGDWVKGNHSVISSSDDNKDTETKGDE